MIRKIIIGARGSKLSLAQTELIRKPLQKLLPKTEITIQVITTTGDKDMSPVPLDTVGKGWFTKELDKALLDGKIDIAVHSLKDIPEELPSGLVIAVIPEREDASEAMVSKENIQFENLKKGAVIGTDSTRRKSQILHMRPDLVVKSLRGNVNRRLQKLEDGEYDGIFLAVAGLKRLGLEGKITQYFDPEVFIPSPGQGALAVVIKKSNKELLDVLNQLSDPNTVASVEAERAFSKAVGGGCKMPVGSYGKFENDSLVLTAMIGSPDGKHLEILRQVADTRMGAQDKKKYNPEELGKKLASSLLTKCKGWYNPLSHGYIVVTRPEENDGFIKKLQYMNTQVFSYPTIKIKKNILSKNEQREIKNIDKFDIVIFTSKHGVTYFIEELKKSDINLEVLKKKYIACVGPTTAEEAEKFGLKVHFIPSEFTTEDLAKELKDVKGKNMLLARSNIASVMLTKELKKRGAKVTDIAIYKTEFVGKMTKGFEKILNDNSITCLTFTSPSTVEGFMKSLTKEIKEKVLSIPVLSIGPVTAKKVEEYNFTKPYVADVYTIDGMINKIQESII